MRMDLPSAFAPMLTELTPLDPDAIAAIRADYPELPEAYLNFLREVGFGNIVRNESGQHIARVADYMLYSGPVMPSEVFGIDETHLDARFLLFGDDYCGNVNGFDRKTGQVVEIGHENREHWVVGATFSDFVGELLRKLTEVRRGPPNTD